MSDKIFSVTVTRTSENADGSGPYTYGYSGTGAGRVNPTTGMIDFRGLGRHKFTVNFIIGDPFASIKSDVGFAEPPIKVKAVKGLFTDITRVNCTHAAMNDNDDDDDAQGYEYKLYFDDDTKLDPRILNRN